MGVAHDLDALTLALPAFVLFDGGVVVGQVNSDHIQATRFHRIGHVMQVIFGLLLGQQILEGADQDVGEVEGLLAWHGEVFHAIHPEGRGQFFHPLGGELNHLGAEVETKGLPAALAQLQHQPRATAGRFEHGFARLLQAVMLGEDRFEKGHFLLRVRVEDNVVVERRGIPVEVDGHGERLMRDAIRFMRTRHDRDALHRNPRRSDVFRH